MTIIVAAAASVALLIIVGVVAGVTIYCRKKNSNQEAQKRNRISDSGMYLPTVNRKQF
jgi:hypothetical protein